MDRLPQDAAQGMASVPDEAPRETETAADWDSALLQQEKRAEQEQPASEVVPTKLAQRALLVREQWMARATARQ
jgi:hypothetical protein